MRTAVNLANVLMTMGFLFSVLVQYNDRDALAWILVYGAAAGVCIAFALGRMRVHYPAVIALIALVWAAVLVPSFWGSVSLGELFESFEMRSHVVERAREFGGLIIVALWMTVLATSRRWGSGSSEAAKDRHEATY